MDRLFSDLGVPFENLKAAAAEEGFDTSKLEEAIDELEQAVGDLPEGAIADQLSYKWAVIGAMAESLNLFENIGRLG